MYYARDGRWYRYKETRRQYANRKARNSGDGVFGMIIIIVILVALFK